MKRPWMQWLSLLAIASLAGTAATEAGAGVKLITMRSGRVLKALNVSEEDGWVTAQLTGENTIGFPREFVTSIEEDPLGTEEEVGEMLNIVTGGREVGGRAAFRAPRAAMPSADANPLASLPEQQEDPPPGDPDPNTAGTVVDQDAVVDTNTVVAPAAGLRSRRLNRGLRVRDKGDN